MKPCKHCGYASRQNRRVALLVDGRPLLDAWLCPEHRVMVEDLLAPALRGSFELPRLFPIGGRA